MTTALLLLLTLCAPLSFGARSDPSVGKEKIVLRTTYGDMVFALYPKAAPKHVAQVINLVRNQVYDTTYFERVRPNFVAQISQAQSRRVPLSPSQAAMIRPLPLELSPGVKHTFGALSMARQENDPNSAETSFSILLGDQPGLDGKYTVFGRLELGYDVLEGIGAAPRKSEDTPASLIEIISAEITDASRLGSMSLRGYVPPPAPAQSPTAVPTSSLGVVGLMMFLGALIYFFRNKSTPRTLGALGLLVAFMGFFIVYSSAAPMAKDSPNLAVAIFIGTIAVFKLMNLFESPQ